ncbi:MAG: hypothetical protein PHN66_04145 [Candidatus Shapirobacteria bacterium]|nr:hypothetical protein [Candidatus Shapirobacteria bacterium]
MKKIIFSLIFLSTLFLFGCSLNQKWLGFYYPDAGNLLISVQSSNEFNYLEECRNWANNMAYSQNRTDLNWDYECGKNCRLDKDYKNLQKYSPEKIKEFNLSPSYICDETLN